MSALVSVICSTVTTDSCTTVAISAASACCSFDGLFVPGFGKPEIKKLNNINYYTFTQEHFCTIDIIDIRRNSHTKSLVKIINLNKIFLYFLRFK